MTMRSQRTTIQLQHVCLARLDCESVCNSASVTVFDQYNYYRSEPVNLIAERNIVAKNFERSWKIIIHERQ